MAKNLKKKDNKSKLSKSKIQNRGSTCEQYPAFSFRYMTTNKNYNFEYFKNNENDKDKMYKHLFHRMKEISKFPYSYWSGCRKGSGSESIPYWRCKINPNDLVLSQDDKIIVFRFCQQKYRLIGIRLDSCPTLHIIGFDFDYSAYDHGN